MASQRASCSVGQALRPINDLVSQFAELMLAASVAFGVMKVMIAIGSFWPVSLLLSIFVVAWSWFRWHRNMSTHAVCTNSLQAIP